jgi:hypothetical protein
MKSLKKTQVGIKMEEKKSTQSLEASLVNRPEETEERLSSLEDKVDVVDSSVKENVNSKSIQTQKIQEIEETLKRPNLQKFIERKTTKSRSKAQKIFKTKL